MPHIMKKLTPLGQSMWPWWLLITLYYLASCLGHLKFSLWLVRGRTISWGNNTYNYAYSYAVPWLASIAAATLAWVVWRQARNSVSAR